MNEDEEDGALVAPTTIHIDQLNRNISAGRSAILEQNEQNMTERNRPQSSTSSTTEGREVEEMINDVSEAEQLRGDALWESYRESVRRHLIDRMTTIEQRKLRNYLRDNGAPIRHGTGIPIYRALTEALPEESDDVPEPLSFPPLPPLVGPSQVTTSGPIYTQVPPTTRTYSQILRSNPRRASTRPTNTNSAGVGNNSGPGMNNSTRSQGIPTVPRSSGQRNNNSNPDQYDRGDAILPRTPRAPRTPTNPPRAPVDPNNRTPQAPNVNNAASRDLLKLYAAQSAKYGGEMEENLHRHKREYDMNCLSLQVSSRKALENVYICLKGVALEYYFAEVRMKVRSVAEAFEMLQKRFISEDRRQRSLMEWQTITFHDCKQEGEDDRKTLSRLLTKAMQLQSQLDVRYHSDEFLRDMLLRATAKESFASTIHLHTPRTSAELIERMYLSIDARSRIKEANDLSGGEREKYSGKEMNATVTPAFAEEFYIRRPQRDTRSKKTMFNRQYGNPKMPHRGPHKQQYSYNNGRRKNPIDRRTGEIMKCRGCGSDSHLLRHCKSASPAQLVYHLSKIDDTDQNNVERVLDRLQKYTDEQWFGKESESEGDFNDVAEIADEAQDVLYASLADESVKHAICPDLTKEIENFFEEQTEDPFEGIIMDHGAQNTVGGWRQYTLYCKHTHQRPGPLRPSSKLFKFGETKTRSMGIAMIRFPTDDAGSYFDYPSDIVQIDVPLLFGLDLMKRYRIRVDEVENTIEQKDQGWKASLTFKKGHLYREWPARVVLFTRTELEKLHRRFAHPTTTKLLNLLRRADPKRVDDQTRETLERIYRSCDPCQRMSPKPFVFQVSMPDDIVFNNEVVVDLMWLDGKPVLHIVDRGTHYSAASFVTDESAETTWNTLVRCWVSLYTGFPCIIAHDKGSLFTSRFFRKACAQFGIVAKEVPTEAHNALSVGERYHAPLRRIYTKIRIECPSLEKEVALSIAVMGLNNTAGPEGLTPTLLVFGTIPRLPIGHIETMLPTQRERLKAMEYSRKEMEEITAQMRLKVAQKDRNRILGMLDLRAGESVLVYRERSRRWEGPYRFLGQNRKTVLVESSRGVKQEFPVVAVKPYNAGSTLLAAVKELAQDYAAKVNVIEIVHDPSDQRFEEPKKKEIQGLIERGAFKIVPKESVPHGANLLKGRFVLAIKDPGTKDQRFKARFVIQGHKDQEKQNMVTEAPTVLRHSVRLLLSLASMLDLEVWTRDITQAYIQSMSDLLRDVYLIPPPNLGIAKDKIIQVMKPHYGITESGSYWWLTYLNYHTEDLGMKQSAMDPCLFYKREGGKLVGLEASLVDDTLSAGDCSFMQLEEQCSKKFDSKARDTSSILKFSGCTILRMTDGFKISQEEYAERVKPISKKDWTPSNFASMRGKLSWLATCTRPDVACANAQLSQRRREMLEEEDYKLLSSAILQIKKHKRELFFPRLDLSSTRIHGYSDAAFANNPDYSSQLGMVITLCDKENRCNIIHYASWKCKRITRSVLAAEVCAFSSCFDFSYTLQSDLKELTGRKIPIVMFTDSKCLFDTITRLKSVTEKRLLIDIASLRQSYTRGELFNIGHVYSQHNLADSLTKRVKSKLLTNAMMKGKLEHPVNQWIVHYKPASASETERERDVLVKEKPGNVTSEQFTQDDTCDYTLTVK